MRKILIAMFFFSAFVSRASAFTLSDFDVPDSMQADPDSGAYYVTNINGEATNKDGNGYISKISPSGSPVIQKFINSKPEEPLLHAPKGLTIVGKNIFVVDIDAVKTFDKISGKFIQAADLSNLGAEYLDDITADPSGLLYVSDTMANKIFRVDPNKNYEVTVFKAGKVLGGPDGIVINPKSKNLIVAARDSGQLLEIEHRSGKVHILKRGLTTPSGIDYDNDGNIYVASFDKGEIYKISFFGRGLLTTYLSGLTSPADISYDRKREELLIPSSKGNTVTTVHNPSKKSSS